MTYSTTQKRNALKNQAELKRLLDENLTREQIANTLKISGATMSLYCDILKYDRPKRKKRDTTMATPERVAEMVAMRKTGWTLDTIGGRYNVSRERVRQILAKHCPDVAIQPKRIVLRTCVVCGAEFNGSYGKTCSHECGRIFRQKTEFTRDLAIQIMEMRKNGMTWDKIAQVVKPGCNTYSWRTKLQRAKFTIFSTKEAEQVFNKRHGPRTEVLTQQKNQCEPNECEPPPRPSWIKRIFFGCQDH